MCLEAGEFVNVFLPSFTYNISHILDPYAKQNSLHTMEPLGKKNMVEISEIAGEISWKRDQSKRL